MKTKYHNNKMFLDIINSHGRGGISNCVNMFHLKSLSTTALKFKDESISIKCSGSANINQDELDCKLFESDITSDIIINKLFDIKSNGSSKAGNSKSKKIRNNFKLTNKKKESRIVKIISSRIKAKMTERKKKLAKFTGGYKSYEHKTVLGNLLTLLSKDSLNEVLKNKLFVEFKKNRGYCILIQLDYFINGRLSGLSPMKSMYITQDTNVELISINILNALNKIINQYNIEGEVCKVSVIWKDWDVNLDYSKMVAPVDRTQIIEEVLREQAIDQLKDQDKLAKITKFMNLSKVINYISEFPTFNSITMLDVYQNSEMYEFIKELCPNIKVTIHKNTNYTDTGLLYFVFDIIPSKKRLICISDNKSWKSTLVYWNSSKYPYIKWTDVLISDNDNVFTREIGDYKYHVENATVKYWEKIYNFPDMIMGYTDKKYNNKIGAIDFETYGDNPHSGGLGSLSVSAGGVALQTGYYKSYYIDPSKGLNNSDDVVINLFIDLFNHINEDKKNRNGSTLYAHNLGRFDSVFILKSLHKTGFVVTGKWTDNDILYLKVRDKERKLSITIKDSFKMVPTSLGKMLKTFECTINKGLFPHKFITMDNLNYIGPKPDIKYYFDKSNISKSDLDRYDNLPDTFNLKQDCLEYLKSDVMGLLEAMEKISLYYFNNFNFNITNFSTLPSLALAIFGFGHKDNKHKIKMIKGPLEKFIRQAYFGGNSNIFVESKNRIVNKGYHYDMNSQFPNAMKSPMPTGNPVFSNNTNLDYYNLGFVFAKITPPSSKVLSNLFLQKRNEDGSVTCPREEFYEYISTVDLKQGIEYGYKAEIICGVNFHDACEVNELFGSFVDKFYEIKSKATDIVSKNIAKLILNSTYGKFGQRDHEYNIRLVNKKTVENLIKTYHYNYLYKISEDAYLIRTGPRLNEKLRRLYAEQYRLELEDNSNYKLSKDRGLQSAVQISAIISAYARTSINPLKNIPGNLAIASNTDSLILRKPLPEKLIGGDLGQWKLEHKFKNGIFVRPKLYCYEDADTNELIRKASGIVAAKLSYNDYIQLVRGNNIITEKTVFNVNWKSLNIEVVNVKNEVKGIDS